MIKLYYAPRTRSTRVRWVLEELEVPYELVRLDLAKGEHKQPEYLAIHPHGLVPAAEIDGVRLIESLAICMHLADLFPAKGLAIAPGTPERGPYDQWFFYSACTLEPELMRYFSATVGPEAGKSAAAASEARAGFDAAGRVLARALDRNEYFFGAQFTAADVVLASMLAWARSMKLLDAHDALDAYVKRATQRPAYRRATI